MRDTTHLARLLCDRIETIDPGFGIEIMSLAATLAEPLVPKKTIGERHLYRFAPVASDLPERSVQKIAPVAPDNGETSPDP